MVDIKADREFEVVEGKGGTTFPIKVVPRASRNEIAGVQAGALKLRLTALPVGGAANRALIKFLAEELGVRRSEVEILRGRTSHRKLVKVVGLSGPEVRARLLG
ncbi:MAG: DUF167 domain-containing protein [Chloroflexota bacterium]|nr:DUF167 domain-containing protein [Chloroflexota bacterium]